MRRYESIIIIDPDLSDDDRGELFERITALIDKYEGILVLQDNWGTRKLAYEVKKRTRGYYALFDYCGSGILVNELERFFRIDDRALKYMTVLLDEDADIDSIKEEINKKESEDDESILDTPAGEIKEELKSNKSEAETQESLSEAPETERVETETSQTENNDKE